MLSAQDQQPAFLPEHLESGTPNVSGICALCAGLDFVKNEGVENIFKKEILLVSKFYNELSENKKVKLISSHPENGKIVPIVLFNIKDMESEKTAYYLDKKGIAVRAGLHCAPYAHKAAGTFPDGAVRVCPSAFLKEEDMLAAACAVNEICAQN